MPGITEEEKIIVSFFFTLINLWSPLTIRDKTALPSPWAPVQIIITWLSGYLPIALAGIIVSLLGYAPATVYLSQVANYPNPFNAAKGEKTRIEYVLTEDSNVTIRIYNLVGDLVWMKENANGKGSLDGYRNEEFWDGRNDAGMIVANGIYLCLISASPTQGGEERKISRLIGVVK